MGDFLQESEAKLQSARKRVRQGRQVKILKESAPLLFEIIDGEISLEVNRAYGVTPLSHDEYLESHGAVRGIKRIRNLLEAKEMDEQVAAQEVDAIEENIKTLKDEAKRQ